MYRKVMRKGIKRIVILLVFCTSLLIGCGNTPKYYEKDEVLEILQDYYASSFVKEEEAADIFIEDNKKVDTSKIKGLDFWPKVIDTLKKSGKILVATNLLNTKLVEINDMTIGIIFINGLTPFVKTVLEKPENHTELVRLISTECGKTMQVKLLDSNDNIVKKKAEESALSEATKDLDISINIIDE